MSGDGLSAVWVCSRDTEDLLSILEFPVSRSVICHRLPSDLVAVTLVSRGKSQNSALQTLLRTNHMGMCVITSLGL